MAWSRCCDTRRRKSEAIKEHKLRPNRRTSLRPYRENLADDANGKGASGSHRKHMKSTNMLERLNEEIRPRTYVVRIFPNAESCLRLVGALTIKRHEAWLEDHRYLNMDLLKQHKKETLRQAA